MIKKQAPEGAKGVARISKGAARPFVFPADWQVVARSRTVAAPWGMVRISGVRRE
jgi:hypothetical protein